ncbi:hypothetical protein E2C01_076138 [Portunus trituberculatus]|uniref:Uncharacterized protein n=1 Tax=Portunus trituberculatus TaxID=210409 RepID=A0A5B7IJ13_PORTR|nr:hypothetical protein [Portunus trituberculatus]
MGDPSKVVMLREVLRVIKRDNLLDNARDTGDILYKVRKAVLLVLVVMLVVLVIFKAIMHIGVSSSYNSSTVVVVVVVVVAVMVMVVVMIRNSCFGKWIKL